MIQATLSCLIAYYLYSLYNRNFFFIGYGNCLLHMALVSKGPQTTVFFLGSEPFTYTNIWQYNIDSGFQHQTRFQVYICYCRPTVSCFEREFFDNFGLIGDIKIAKLIDNETHLTFLVMKFSATTGSPPMVCRFLIEPLSYNFARVS